MRSFARGASHRMWPEARQIVEADAELPGASRALAAMTAEGLGRSIARGDHAAGGWFERGCSAMCGGGLPA